MSITCFIPNKIKVGYQKRKDTYSGKLAYVIYYDEKNKIRKEQSFESWRDKQIKTDEFENEMLEGFVLNKKAGDYSDWFHRQAYVRVFDPRGFEIEITINNLLYILENCDCIKGKGLIGKFCYGWNGKELVLLSENTKEYNDSKKYSENLFENKKIKKEELEIGRVYTLKGNKKCIYLGQYKTFASFYNEYKGANGKWLGKQHLYIRKESFGMNNPTIYNSTDFCPISIESDLCDISAYIEKINQKTLFTGKALVYYSKKEFNEIINNAKHGFKVFDDNSNDFNANEVKKINENNEVYLEFYKKSIYFSVVYKKIKINDYFKYNSPYYIGIFKDGNLIAKEKEIIVF